MKTVINEKNKIIEWIVFVLFVISFIIISFFHEPWFDEAEAWQIARCASIKELLFEIPHIEGHPSLWHLILCIPAKCGFPYELSLTVISCLITSMSCWMILFKSPFHRVFRLLIPFHYFFFYQYGIVARPYCLMLLALLLMAAFFKNKDDKPWPFVLAMLFLCVSSGYGIVLAGGVSIAWTIDICKQKKWAVFSKDFWTDKRVLPLCFLLLCAILIILQIMPIPNTFALQVEYENPLILRLFYTVFVMLPDSMVSMILEGEMILKAASLSFVPMISGMMICLLIYGIIILISNKKQLKYFFIPYFLFCGFSAVVYFYSHHMGIAFIFLLFWLWTAMEEPKEQSIYKAVSRIEEQSSKDKKKLAHLMYAICLFFITVPLIWSLVASLHEVQYPYFWGRDTAAFLKDHGMENAFIMSSWYDWNKEDKAEGNNKEKNTDFAKMNVYEINKPISILPYSDTMVCSNLNFGDPNKAYDIHIMASKEENVETIESWRKMGFPDVTIGYVDLRTIFGFECEIPRYKAVYQMVPNRISIWKIYLNGIESYNPFYVYVREDLIEDYGFRDILQ